MVKVRYDEVEMLNLYQRRLDCFHSIRLLLQRHQVFDRGLRWALNYYYPSVDFLGQDSNF